jgi:hypothetical protein
MLSTYQGIWGKGVKIHTSAVFTHTVPVKKILKYIMFSFILTQGGVADT